MYLHLKDKNFIIAGGTGSGIGFSIAVSLIHILQKGEGSLTILSRDIKKSFEFETGIFLQQEAIKKNIPFFWDNSGMNLKEEWINKILVNLSFLSKNKSIIYINTVSAASSGVQEGYPNIFVKDFDQDGIFQWSLPILKKEKIDQTKSIMGEVAVKFPKILEKNGWSVKLAIFSDWRGSLDKVSRDPNRIEYGRQGAYSSSLYLPKDIIQKEVHFNYLKGEKWLNIFYPLMPTRALFLIPGGKMMYQLMKKLLQNNQLENHSIAKLGLMLLHFIVKLDIYHYPYPFLRFDLNEVTLLKEYHEKMILLNNNLKSNFYYKKWVE